MVIYVNKDNAKTVSAQLSSGKFTGLQAILNAYQKGNVTTPLAIRVLGLIKTGQTDTFESSAEGIQIKGEKPIVNSISRLKESEKTLLSTALAS